MRSLADAGVRDVVISPGSRSTPFVVAAVREARLTCHTVVDERAAAFFALGQARVVGAPSVLLCTSGTAGAHYLPAIIEAGASFVPLLVLTADRPGELTDCAAPQTIDQVKLFGQHVRHFFDLGTPDPAEPALRAVRRIAAQASFASLWPTPGAAHINARARKPLEPVTAASQDALDLAALVKDIVSTPITSAHAPSGSPDHVAVRSIASECRGSRRGLIVCGPAPASQRADSEALFALAAATRFPIVCEATSQLRFTKARDGVTVVDAVDPLLASAAFRRHAKPDLVIQVGTPPVAGGWERMASSPALRRIVVAAHGWNDPESVASTLLFADPGLAARALCEALAEHARGPSTELEGWNRLLGEADAGARAAVEADVLAHAALTEGAVARTVGACLPHGSSWMLGNSLAVRLVDTYCARTPSAITVLSQRGASGIDGLIAGAVGAATKSSSAVTLLLGDISFLHDMTSLALAPKVGVPLVIVVLQNHGGRVFEQLPLASAPGIEPEVLAHTLTPHSFDFAHAAKLFGVRFARVDTTSALGDELSSAYERPECTLLEATVEPHGAAEQRRRIFAAVDARMKTLFEPTAERAP